MTKLQLNEKGLRSRESWLEKGYTLPGFDRNAMIDATLQNPVWLHFGAGNLFRAFPAVLQQKLLNDGLTDKGVLVCEGFDGELLELGYFPYDNLALQVVLKPDGNFTKQVVGSVAASLRTDSPEAEGWETAVRAFQSPSLQVASFTITEKGYRIRDFQGNLLPAVQNDLLRGGRPVCLMGQAAYLCLCRYEAGAAPLAMVSMDNCSQNGDRLRESVLDIAGIWVNQGKAPEGFIEYLTEKVSFPWTMIDKITPQPSGRVAAQLSLDGLCDISMEKTARGSLAAPFVNTEETEYLVVEDDFPNGRPLWEKAGVYFTSRDTVRLAERMKVSSCLNPLHTALAVFGCLLGYQTIWEEMMDPDLTRLAERLGYAEGLPAASNPQIFSAGEFLRTVLEIRLPNPYLPDTPQRIAADTSQKIPIRFGETLKTYAAREDLDIQRLTAIPLVLAGWLRYLTGIGDDGRPFSPSPDPMLAELTAVLKPVKLGCNALPEDLRALLSRTDIFGVDLYAVGLGERVEANLLKMLSAPGAVRQALKEI